MKKFIVPAIALLCITLTGAASAKDASEIRFALHNPRVEVAAAYETFNATEAGTKRSLYNSYPLSMREDLWIVHLENFLRDHDELTVNQRGVVLEAIGLLASGGLQAHANSVAPDGMTDALARLDLRIRAEFPHQLAIEAFAQLGNTLELSREARPSRLQPRSQWLVKDECSCNQRHNFCDTVTNPTPYCAARACKGLPTGCGWLWAQTCDGLCSSTP